MLGRQPDDEQQERNNREACLQVALLHGHTKEEAENCDDGSVGCPDCPFTPEWERNPIIAQVKMSDESIGFCNNCGVILRRPDAMDECPCCKILFTNPKIKLPLYERANYTLFKKLEE